MIVVRRSREEGLSDKVEFLVGDARELQFADGSFDLVIAECVTTLVDKSRVFPEMLRVIRPGGYLGDLEMTWRSEPPPEAVEKTREVWGGYETFTLTRWRDVLTEVGLGEVQVVDFSETLAQMERAIRHDLGLRGELKLAVRLAMRSDLRKAIYAYWRLFEEYSQYIGYGYFVGRRPATVTYKAPSLWNDPRPCRREQVEPCGHLAPRL